MGQTNDKKAEGKPAGKSNPVGDMYEAPFRGYVNVNLSEADRRDFDVWEQTTAVWDVLEAAAADGIRVSVKWSPKEKCFVGSATQLRSGSPNAGLVVTARGRTAGKAFSRALYCVFFLGTEKPWEVKVPIADPDRW